MALMVADIPQIVDAVKKGLPEFLATTQISDTVPTDREDEFDFISECYICVIVLFLEYLIVIMNFLKSLQVHVRLAL